MRQIDLLKHGRTFGVRRRGERPTREQQGAPWTLDRHSSLELLPALPPHRPRLRRNDVRLVARGRRARRKPRQLSPAVEDIFHAHRYVDAVALAAGGEIDQAVRRQLTQMLLAVLAVLIEDR